MSVVFMAACDTVEIVHVRLRQPCPDVTETSGREQGLTEQTDGGICFPPWLSSVWPKQPRLW